MLSVKVKVMTLYELNVLVAAGTVYVQCTEMTYT